METISNTEYKSILGYLPATIIKNVIENKDDLSKDLPHYYTINSVALFSDISGFTKLSEYFSIKGRHGAEFLTFCINRYMEQIINIIGANGGDIFKFVGDALMVTWPPNHSKNFLENACKRACKCALDIQIKLNNFEIVKNKSLSVKIGIGVGKLLILFVGGLFKRCEYLCVGEGMRQACEAETYSSGGGQVIISEHVKKYVENIYLFEEAKVQPNYTKSDNLHYFLIVGYKDNESNEKIKTKADAFLIRKMFDIQIIRSKIKILRTFIPAGVLGYLNLEKENWCKEIRLVTGVFLKIDIDLSCLKNKNNFTKIQNISKLVQRCAYRTHGALNKFLMDEKGSVMLIAWGLPPLSFRNDPIDAICSCITILKEFKKININCCMGVTTGTCFTGVCGTVGNRREYSMLGEAVNKSSRFMSMGANYMKLKNLNGVVFLDENTKNLIQNKLRCGYVLKSKVKGFSIEFPFFIPVDLEDDIFPNKNDPFPFIRTHCNNPVDFYDFSDDKSGNVKKCLKKCFDMAGRVKEFEIFLGKLNDCYKRKLKKFFMVKGEYGCGKSFFIRKVLYSFFTDIKENKELGNLYLNNNKLQFPNIVLCAFQYPMLEHVPFNGIAMIFRQIYLWLNKNVFAKEKKGFDEINIKKQEKRQKNLNGKLDYNNNYSFETVTGDTLAEIICKTNCLDKIEVIEEMLSCSKEDIYLKEHFLEIDYENNIKPIIKKYKISEGNENRDPFFSQLKISEPKYIINFLIELLILYRNKINQLKHIAKEIPLFLVIEDTHCIDKYSIDFLTTLLKERHDHLRPLFIILSYQNEFGFLKHKNDLIIKDENFIKNMTLHDFKIYNRSIEESIVNNIQIKNITSIQEIEEFIKNYFLENKIYEKFDSLFKVDPNLIRTLVDKSCGGNPLLIRDLLDEFLKKHYIQNCVSEILITSELDDMEKQRNWNDFKIPLRIEKLCGEMIDSTTAKEIILLKYACTIGNLFDIQTLHSIFPFKGVMLFDIYEDLKNLEKKGLIEFLYDLDPKNKIVICKFAVPFLKETLYQRMLIEQRSEIHMQISRLIQKNQVYYLPSLKLEKINLRKQLENGQKSIIKEMETIQDIEEGETLNLNSLKILIVKEICDKLKNMKNTNINDEDIEQIDGRKKLAMTLKYGMIEKKSDGKITWENRFFVMTAKHISYYYHLDEYINGKVPLAILELKDIYEIKLLKDKNYGNKKNLFQVSVSRWVKKEKFKGRRIYIFSTKNIEDLYSWVISMNFLRVNAYYENFIGHFGKVGLPLYKTSMLIKKPKKYLFNYNVQNQFNDSSFLEKNVIKYRKKIGSMQLEKERNLEKIAKIDIIESEYKKKLKFLVSNTFSYILGHMQHRIESFDKDEYNNKNGIHFPKHLNYFIIPLLTNYIIQEKNDSVLSITEKEKEKEKSPMRSKRKSKHIILNEESKNSSVMSIEKIKEENNNNNNNNKIFLLFKKEKIEIGVDDMIHKKMTDVSGRVTDTTRTHNQYFNQIINNTQENEDEDSIKDSDINFDSDDAEETHLPQFFIKDKNISDLYDIKSEGAKNTKRLDAHTIYERLEYRAKMEHE